MWTRFAQPFVFSNQYSPACEPNRLKHFLLFYEAEPDYEERRKPLRAAHLEHAHAAAARGDLVLGGAFANPIDGAVILFRGDSPSAAADFARNDPYVVNGLVKRWYVREWTTVVGAALNPQP